MAIDPELADIEAFVAARPDEPVVMLNLVRFRPDGGRERYLDYLARAEPKAAAVGAEVVYLGLGDDPLVAERGQEWDAVLLVRYPSRRAFGGMTLDPGYQPLAELRASALVESVLQPTSALGAAAAPRTLADAFDHDPHQWGLRGDVHVWSAMRERLAGVPVPEGAHAVRSAYVEAFNAVVGVDLYSSPEETVRRPELDHGGMSGGMVDLRWWRATGIPLLLDRATR